MRLRFGLPFVCLLAAACASEDSRYRDISALEKPPTLTIEKQEAVDQGPETTGTDKRPGGDAPSSDAGENRADTASKIKRGLGDQVVSISEAPPLVLTIRQTFDTAWNSLKRALIQNGIEVTDLEHDKGKFYVNYDADRYVSEHGSLMESTFALFSNDYAEQAYVLTVSPEGSATQVTVTLAKDTEPRKKADRDDEEIAEDAGADADKPTDGADKLLRSLYLVLRDKLRED
jgi:hypothetical protein